MQVLLKLSATQLYSNEIQLQMIAEGNQLTNVECWSISYNSVCDKLQSFYSIFFFLLLDTLQTRIFIK